MTWLRERYPELFEGNGARAAMSQFDVILCIRYGVMEHRAASFYTLSGGASTEFALHLHRDSGLRERVAATVGLSLEQFDQDAPDLLRAAFPLGSFGNSDPNVPGALESGARW